MVRDESPAQTLFTAVVKDAVTSLLKPLGFRKSSLNFHRRHREVVQVVNLQLSSGTTSNEKLFYVNVGLAFDSVCQLTQTEILEQPKEHDCVSRGTRGRLESLLTDTPERWSVGADADTESVAEPLQGAMEKLAVDLETIDSVHAYHQHRWFDRFRPTQENAQILNLLDDLSGAWNEILHLCDLFADRQAINQPRWWIDELGLVQLIERCNS